MQNDYCMECLSKHSGAAIKYCEEAQDYYIRSGKMDELVQKKMRSVTKELAGMADDMGADSPGPVQNLYNKFQMVRKKIDMGKLEYGGGKIEDVKKIQKELEDLRDELFNIRKTADFHIQPIVDKIMEKTGIKQAPVEQTSNSERREVPVVTVEPTERIENAMSTIADKAKKEKKEDNMFDKLIEHMLLRL